jgi:hypothetical protein
MEKIDINVLLNKFKPILYKSFVDLIFHGLLWKKTQILEPFPMESLTPSNRVHLGEINKRIFEKLNKIDLQTTSIQNIRINPINFKCTFK